MLKNNWVLLKIEKCRKKRTTIEGNMRINKIEILNQAQRMRSKNREEGYTNPLEFNLRESPDEENIKKKMPNQIQNYYNNNGSEKSQQVIDKPKIRKPSRPQNDGSNIQPNQNMMMSQNSQQVRRQMEMQNQNKLQDQIRYQDQISNQIQRPVRPPQNTEMSSTPMSSENGESLLSMSQINGNKPNL